MNIAMEPFRHAIIDGLWDEGLLQRVLSEFPDPGSDGWIRYSDNTHEVKLEGGSHLWGPSTFQLTREIAAIGPMLAIEFGLPDLLLRTEGGGFHHIEPGGRLAVHADFNKSEDGLFRRPNIIVYLNRDWTYADGRYLELWDEGKPVATVAVRAENLCHLGRCVYWKLAARSRVWHVAGKCRPGRAVR